MDPAQWQGYQNYLAESSEPRGVTLIHHLQIAYYYFARAMVVDPYSAIWPENTFPGNIILTPRRIQLWIDFPRLQEEVWTKIMGVPEFLASAKFSSEEYLHYIAMAIHYAPVVSDATLRYFQIRTLDESLRSIIHFMGKNQTLKDTFRLRGDLVPDRTCLDCIAITTMGFEEPIYAMCYIPPYCLTLPELVAGLRATETASVFTDDPVTFEKHATAMVVHAITRIFSRMVSVGTRHGYICTGDAYVFLNISAKDPGILEYYLCVPGQNVPARNWEDATWVQHTALGQVLAFALQALTVARPSHRWHDTAYKSLSVSHEDFTLLMPNTADILRFNPPAEFLFENSVWNGFWKSLATKDLPIETADSQASGSPKVEVDERPYCTMACLRGTVEKEPLDANCPNFRDHGTERHSISSQEIVDGLNEQLSNNRYEGFRQLHVIGRTCYLLKATLLSHGYTVMIKATTARQSRRIKDELRNYRDLILLQGNKIPVCLGMFKPQVTYWYHGCQMRYMMVLSWSGFRMDAEISPEMRNFVEGKLKKLKETLREHGVVHRDAAYRNVLWYPPTRSLMMIDLEDMKWCQGTVQGSKPVDGPGIEAMRGDSRGTQTGPEASLESKIPHPRQWHS